MSEGAEADERTRGEDEQKERLRRVRTRGLGCEWGMKRVIWNGWEG